MWRLGVAVLGHRFFVDDNGRDPRVRRDPCRRDQQSLAVGDQGNCAGLSRRGLGVLPEGAIEP